MKQINEIDNFDYEISEDQMYHKLQVRATAHMVEETTLEELNDFERILLSLADKIIKRDYEKSLKNIMIQRNTNRISDSSSENTNHEVRVDSPTDPDSFSNTMDYDSEAEFTASEQVPEIDESEYVETLSLYDRTETKEISDNLYSYSCKPPYHKRAIQSLINRNNNSKMSKKPKKRPNCGNCGDYYSEKTSTYTSMQYGTNSSSHQYSFNRSNSNFTSQTSGNNNGPTAQQPYYSSSTSTSNTSSADSDTKLYFSSSSKEDPKVKVANNQTPIQSDQVNSTTPDQIVPTTPTTPETPQISSETSGSGSSSSSDGSGDSDGGSDGGDGSGGDKSGSGSKGGSGSDSGSNDGSNSSGSSASGESAVSEEQKVEEKHSNEQESVDRSVDKSVDQSASPAIPKKSTFRLRDNTQYEIVQPRSTAFQSKSFFRSKRYTIVSKENVNRIYRFHLPLSFYYGVEDEF